MIDINEKIPLHFSTKNANCKVYFNSTDSHEQWIKNLSNPDHQFFFAKNDWINSESIIYEYNSHGFRDTEFDNQPAALALGCSFTEGIGLRTDQTWPYMVQNQLGFKVWNLGVGSSSSNTVFRLLEYYIKQLNVSTVFVLQPYNERTEVFIDGHPISCLPQMQVLPVFYKQWLLDDQNSYYELMKNKLAMKQLCNEKNVRFVSLSIGELTDGNPNNDRARDLQHYGPRTQQHISENFIKQYHAKQ